MNNRPRRKRLLKWGIACLIAAAICVAFPPVHFVRIETSATSTTASTANGTFAPNTFARDFWTQRLVKAIPRATEMSDLLSAVQKDPKAARTKYGHSVGLGGSRYYFVRGSGKIVGNRGTSVAVVLDASSSASPDLMLDTGKLFGNAVRDGTGLLNVNDFPNSRDFNDLSSALNEIVETEVAPPLRSAPVGSQVRFAGVIEVSDEQMDLHPPHVIPIQAEVR